MAIEAITDRPPYVFFEMRGKEDRKATVELGHYVEKDIAIAVISRPGSKDTLEKEAEVWLKEVQEKARLGEVPPAWAPHFRGQFDSWLKGETGAVNGTPIKGWGSIGPSAQKMLIAAGVLTVEDLANMPDQDLQNLGTGAVSFKQKARTFIDAANGPGKMAEAIAALTVKLDALADLTRKQAEEIERLRKFEPKPAVK